MLMAMLPNSCFKRCVPKFLFQKLCYQILILKAILPNSCAKSYATKFFLEVI